MLDVSKSNVRGILAAALTAQLLLLAVPCAGQLRKAKVGDTLTEFSLPLLKGPNEPNDPNANMFAYDPNSAKVLGVVFVSPAQRLSVRAMTDIAQIVKDLRPGAEAFDFVAVVSGQRDGNLPVDSETNGEPAFTVLLDTQYKLWGRLGVVAMPTVLIVGKDAKIQWITAGHGYDFAPALRDRLNRALGIAPQGQAEDSIEVKTLVNTGVEAKLRRHLRMGVLLLKKGRPEMAAIQLRKAQQLDPNSVEVMLELGELFCRTGQGQKALELVDKVNPDKVSRRGRLLMISGWANRLIGDLDQAEKLLTEATQANPRASRSFYELGKVHHTAGRPEKAMQAYYKALALLFDEPLTPDFPKKTNSPEYHQPTKTGTPKSTE